MRIIPILIFSLLSACTTKEASEENLASKKQHHTKTYNRYKYKHNRYTQKKDGAPTKSHNVSFKEPVPTKEPLSRYGNPSEYRVDGQKYHVLKSSDGYKARGIASWYGTKFHKQRTSSGEPYDMYVMTAAHKTLPLPTYVKVKNLENGREAVVKVNDRGPFHGNRVIDLSYAAALKLGVFPKGTARVEVESIVGPDPKGRYYVQAGAFAIESAAKGLKEKLAAITSAPVLIEHYQKNYIVKVGPFADKKMSDSLKLKLARIGILGAFSILI